MAEEDHSALLARLGHEFEDLSLLRLALCHGSYAAEHPEEGGRDNQRLEFLGDAVLSLCVSHLLMERFPDIDEGHLTRMRAALVSETRLAEIAQDIGLGEHILLSRGETGCRGFEKPSILSGCMEALLGAVYYDGGFASAFAAVKNLVGDLIKTLPDELSLLDPKTHLQELCQARFQDTPLYEEIGEDGPDHDKTFFVRVSLPNGAFGDGAGRSKKAAAQEAAAQALKALSRPE